MKKAILAIIIVFLVLTGVFAKGTDDMSTVQVALSGSPDSLDPHKTSGTLTFQTIRSIYDTLVEPDRDGRIVPALAESWQVSDDSLVWTFRLRDGVTFHDGSDFDARDVAATFNRVLDESVASPNAADFAAISDVEAADDLTVVFTLSEPFAPLLSSFASGWGAILPSELIESGHDFGIEPVGTGPFVLSEYLMDSRAVLTRNEDYWMEGYPLVDEVVLNIIPEPAVQLQGLLSGQVDILANYAPSDEDLKLLEGYDSVEINRNVTALVMVIAMNTSRDYLDDIRLRQAVAHAVDKQAVLDIAYGGGEPVGTFMDINDPFYEDFTGLYPYDPDRAEQLIAELEIPEDVVFTMTLPQNFDPHVKAGQLYQEMLEKVGLKVEIRLVDWSTWISDTYRAANYDMTVIGHTGKLDPDGRLAGYGDGGMYVRWTSPRAAQAIETARSVLDFEERRRLYTVALEEMARDVPFVFVGTNYRYIFTRERISGFHMDQKLDSFDFRFVEVE